MRIHQGARTFPHRPAWCIAVAIVALQVRPVGAGTAVASAQIREGDLVSEDLAVFEISNPRVNHQLGWAFRVVSTNDTGDGLFHYFGSASGGSGAMILTSSTIGRYEQMYFANWFGMSDAGALAYSALLSNNTRSAWIDDSLYAIEGEPTGEGSTYWADIGAIGMTGDGIPILSGQLTSTQGGSAEQEGIFLGSASDPLLLGGQSIPNLPVPLQMTAVLTSLGFAHSETASNFITAVPVTGGAGGKDLAIVLNGEGLVLDGTLVRRGNVIPTSIGGLENETWKIFLNLDVIDDGQYVLGALTTGPSLHDRLLVMNGKVLHRMSDVVDGELLESGPKAVDLNEDGDLAFAWNLDAAQAALFVNGKIILRKNDLVDWDGDGVLDPGHTLNSIGEIALSDRLPGNVVNIYFTGFASTPTRSLHAAFRMAYQLPDPISIADFVSSDTFQPPPDGAVDAADLAFLLGEWGLNPGSPADIVDSATFQPPPDGVVDAADLAFLLGEWTP